MWDVTISLAIMPSLPVKHDLIVTGGWGPSARWRDAPDTSSRLTSFSIEARGSEVICVTHLTLWVLNFKSSYG